MDLTNRKSEEPTILSPKPMRLSVEVSKRNIINPFDEISPLQRSLSCTVDQEVNSELNFILNADNFPMSKSLPSPLFSKFSERPPTRHRINPIIHDENFLKIDSTSTASDEL